MLIAVLFALGLSAIGLGQWPLRLIAPKLTATAVSGLSVAGMLGLIVAAETATAANFLFRLSPLVGPILGVIGLVLFGSLVAAYADRKFWIVYALLVGAFAILASSLQIGPDGGWYHLPLQQWLASEKIVFGLANFYPRLGFNSSLEPLLASAWLSDGTFAAAPLLASLFGLFFVLFLAGTLEENAGDPVAVFLATMFGVGFLWITGTISVRTGWVSTDVPAAFAGLLSVYWFVVAAGRHDGDALSLSFAFAASAVSLKLATGLAMLLPIALAVVWTVRGPGRPAWGRIGLIALAFVPWIARGIITSGCLAFPIAASCLPLPWAATIVAADEAAFVTVWARAPETGMEYLAGWSWLPVWFDRVFWFVVSWVAIAVLACAVALAVGKRRPTSLPLTPGTLALLAAYAIGASAIWLVGAPSPRFGVGQLLILAILPGLWIVATNRPLSDLLGGRVVVGGVLAAVIAAAAGYGLATRPADAGSVLAFDSPPVPEVMTETVDDVTRPVADGQCFAAPIPCSPYGQAREVAIGPYRAYMPTNAVKYTGGD